MVKTTGMAGKCSGASGVVVARGVAHAVGIVMDVVVSGFATTSHHYYRYL